MSAHIELLSTSPEQTRACGNVLGEALRGGDVVALEGPLGAGKTQFIKGIATGLGVPDDEPVVSPTFMLARQYAGRLKLYHLDAYRLNSAAELLAVGLEEMLEDAAGVVVLEWADRVRPALPAPAFAVRMNHGDVGLSEPNTRLLHITAADTGREAELARRLAAILELGGGLRLTDDPVARRLRQEPE